MWPPEQTQTQTLQRGPPLIYFSKFVCFMKCQLLSSAIVYQFLWLILLLSGLLSCRNSLNQFCLSAWHPANVTLQQQIPPPATQNHLTACITAKLCQPLLGHGIWRNKQLIITCENAFLSAFLSVWGWPSELRGGRGSHQNKLQAAALVKEVLLVVATGVCVTLFWFLSHSHTHCFYISHWRLITVCQVGTYWM